MKKITTLIALLLITITLASCSSNEEPFVLESFTISRISTVYQENTQYDSKYNVEATNTSLFANSKIAIQTNEVIMISNLEDITPDGDSVYMTILTSNGVLVIFSATYLVDDVETEVTIVEFNESSSAYSSIEMYNELLPLFK